MGHGERGVSSQAGRPREAQVTLKSALLPGPEVILQIGKLLRDHVAGVLLMFLGTWPGKAVQKLWAEQSWPRLLAGAILRWSFFENIQRSTENSF